MKPEIELCADVLVIGTGLAGICDSVQAARLGCSVILLEKGRTLGGNSGPEVGVHPGGVRSYHPYASETGIMGEILKEAAWIRAKTWTKRQHYNISQLWDSVLNKKLSDAGVNVMRCHYARTVNMQDNKIESVIVDDTQTYHTKIIHVKVAVIESSGDGHIAKESGAEYSMGREGCLVRKQLMILIYL